MPNIESFPFCKQNKPPSPLDMVGLWRGYGWPMTQAINPARERVSFNENVPVPVVPPYAVPEVTFPWQQAVITAIADSPLNPGLSIRFTCAAGHPFAVRDIVFAVVPGLYEDTHEVEWVGGNDFDLPGTYVVPLTDDGIAVNPVAFYLNDIGSPLQGIGLKPNVPGFRVRRVTVNYTHVAGAAPNVDLVPWFFGRWLQNLYGTGWIRDVGQLQNCAAADLAYELEVPNWADGFVLSGENQSVGLQYDAICHMGEFRPEKLGD